MYHQLSKRDKKIAKACIDKGLEAEFHEGLQTFEAIIREWKNGKFATDKEAYHALYKAVDKKDHAIARRYDGLTGSRWLITVADILQDGYISEESINDFSDETKDVLKGWLGSRKTQ
jgi:hypothetical protein